MKILIVDDDEKIVRSTAVYLRTKGFDDIDTLTDSREVIKKVIDEEYDVILLDLNMPFVSGISIIKELASICLDTKLFIISAVDNIEIISNVIKLGAMEYFTKPIDNERLIKNLNIIKFKSENDNDG